jgi:hypothetical protein
MHDIRPGRECKESRGQGKDEKRDQGKERKYEIKEGEEG